MKKTTIATLAAGAVLLASAGSAQAVNVQYATGSDTVGPTEVGFAEADCPTFGRPTGGGTFSSGAWGESYVTALELDDAFFGRETYQAWSYATPEVTLFANVACVKGRAAQGLRYKTKERTIPATSSTSLVAKCPDGLPVVGGEVTHDAPGAGVILQASRPAAGNAAWSGELLNSGAAAQRMFVTAACASGGLAKRLTYVKHAGTAPQGEQDFVQSDCPPGSEVVGGGVRLVSQTFANVNSTGVLSAGTSTASYVDAGPTNARFTNYAICHG